MPAVVFRFYFTAKFQQAACPHHHSNLPHFPDPYGILKLFLKVNKKVKFKCLVPNIQSNTEQTCAPSYTPVPRSRTKEKHQFQWINKYIKLLYEMSVFTLMLIK